MEKAGRKSPLLQLQMIVEFDEIRSVFSNICKTRFSSVVCKLVHNRGTQIPKAISRFLVIRIATVVGVTILVGLCNKIVTLILVFDVRVQAVDPLISGPVYYSLVKSQ